MGFWPAPAQVFVGVKGVASLDVVGQAEEVGLQVESVIDVSLADAVVDNLEEPASTSSLKGWQRAPRPCERSCTSDTASIKEHEVLGGMHEPSGRKRPISEADVLSAFQFGLAPHIFCRLHKLLFDALLAVLRIDTTEVDDGDRPGRSHAQGSKEAL